MHGTIPLGRVYTVWRPFAIIPRQQYQMDDRTVQFVAADFTDFAPQKECGVLKPFKNFPGLLGIMPVGGSTSFEIRLTPINISSLQEY